MSQFNSAAALAQRIQQLIQQRQEHTNAISRIDSIRTGWHGTDSRRNQPSERRWFGAPQIARDGDGNLRLARRFRPLWIGCSPFQSAPESSDRATGENECLQNKIVLWR